MIQILRQIRSTLGNAWCSVSLDLPVALFEFLSSSSINNPKLKCLWILPLLQTDPPFPRAATNRSWTDAVNFTTDYERNAGRVTAELDYGNARSTNMYRVRFNRK